MTFLPLTLGVGSTSATEGGRPKTLSKAHMEKIFQRDQFTCRFCGFRSIQYQRCVPYEGDTVTACSFCEQVVALDRAGLAGSGVLIWLPEISQTDLHHMARAIYVARADEAGEMFDAATRALDALMARRTDAKKRLGSDDPLLLATVLQENLTEPQRADAVRKLEGVRLMPLDKYWIHGRQGETNIFPQIVKFWRSAQGPFADLQPDSWREWLDKIAA